MKLQAIRAEALQRAECGASVSNFPAIYSGFLTMGIPEGDIRPRENIFTYQAWQAKARQVRKGEHGVRIVTYIHLGEKRADDGELLESGESHPRSVTVFHVSQTDPITSGNGNGNGKTKRNGHRKADIPRNDLAGTFTTAPADYHGRDLYDWGERGLRLHGNPRIKGANGRPRKSFDTRWISDPAKIHVPDPATVRAVKKITPEVWPVKKRFGKFWKTVYYLTSKRALDMSAA